MPKKKTSTTPTSLGLNDVVLDEIGQTQGDTNDLEISSSESEGFCSLFFGCQGSGKSLLVAGLVLLGYKVLVFHFGMGRHGLKSARTWYERASGLKDFYDHCKVITIDTYEQAMRLKNNRWKQIEVLAKGNPGLEDFLPACNVIALEEINGIQTLIDEEILGDSDLSPESSTNDKDAIYSYYRNQKAGTEKILKGILRIRSPHQPLSFLMTCHDKSRDFKSQGIKQKDVLTISIAGQALNAILAAPDHVIRCYYETSLGFGDASEGKEYFYEFESPDGSSITKVRGIGFPLNCPADPVKIWRVLANGESPSILDTKTAAQ